MVRYPALVAAVDGLDLVDLSLASGVPVDVIRALVAGTHPAPPGVQLRLARALDANPLVLFRLDDALEQVIASAPSRYVS